MIFLHNPTIWVCMDLPEYQQSCKVVWTQSQILGPRALCQVLVFHLYSFLISIVDQHPIYLKNRWVLQWKILNLLQKILEFGKKSLSFMLKTVNFHWTELLSFSEKWRIRACFSKVVLLIRIYYETLWI